MCNFIIFIGEFTAEIYFILHVFLAVHSSPFAMPSFQTLPYSRLLLSRHGFTPLLWVKITIGVGKGMNAWGRTKTTH